jgi:glycosyltransferase involved in cell wall biosynthesis
VNGATPRVSVVLPVRNGGGYLHAAVASILGQTLADLELVVIDDGSTDDSRAVVRAFGDERIRLVEQEPRGLVASLNHGLELARAPLVARMDADDVSLPERLARQAALLDARPGVGLVCPSFRVVDAAGAELGRTLLPLRDHELRMRLLLRNPFSHGAVMTRRSVLDAVGPYSDAYGNNEDYDLWRRIAARRRPLRVPRARSRRLEDDGRGSRPPPGGAAPRALGRARGLLSPPARRGERQELPGRDA